MSYRTRDHGGALDAAIARFAGAREDWLDLSTGVNPTCYPVGDIDATDWAALPDKGANARLLTAARTFWNVPDGASIVAAPGASSLIARLPFLRPAGRVKIDERTYNEHASAFETAGWTRCAEGADARVVVHPNNPDGRLFPRSEFAASDEKFLIIDESFCDCIPQESHIGRTTEPGVIILKSFGKFWGLAGLRLGFAVAHPETLAPLGDLLGPWPVSGPAHTIGTRALSDTRWATGMRARLGKDAARLDDIMRGHGATIIGGTTLFRLFAVENAARLYERLGERKILGRVFPYSDTWLRLGLPADEHGWERLNDALSGET